MTNTAQIYFKRFKCYPPLITAPLCADTKMVIVIPCYDESDLLTTLRSLAFCDSPRNPVEVMVIVNEPHNAPAVIRQSNERTVQEAKVWIAQYQGTLSFSILYVNDLPPKHAGVGLARKIGMDEALRRFASVGYNGWIVCLDADCEVATNYLTVLEAVFLREQPQSATIYFEHRLSAVADPELRSGIIHYELFLRYYINALRYAEFPYAMHTVGSSMAVRAELYARVGGMNRRQAGEDFYFLHKIAPHGRLREITETTVYPSARVSQRVPFGTGRAQAEWLQQVKERHNTYHLAIFEELKTFFSFAVRQHAMPEEEIKQQVAQLPRLVQSFLRDRQYVRQVKAMRATTTQSASLTRKFFAWFNGFMVLKYVHYAREHGYASVPLLQASRKLLDKLGQPVGVATVEETLAIYRRLDRHLLKQRL